MDSWYWKRLIVWTQTYGIDNTHGFDLNSRYSIGSSESHTYKRAKCYPYACQNIWCQAPYFFCEQGFRGAGIIICKGLPAPIVLLKQPRNAEQTGLAHLLFMWVAGSHQGFQSPLVLPSPRLHSLTSAVPWIQYISLHYYTRPHAHTPAVLWLKSEYPMYGLPAGWRASRGQGT